MAFAPSAFPSLIPRLRTYRLPSRTLPLSADRSPFALLTDVTIARAIFLATQYPEKQGRLSSAVHRLLGIHRAVPEIYRVIEAHLQITHDSIDLRDGLTSLGFEPDASIGLSLRATNGILRCVSSLIVYSQFVTAQYGRLSMSTASKQHSLFNGARAFPDTSK
jgi:hypothetical protein